MARGKKLKPQQVYDIMSSWAVTGNFAETSRELGYAVSTVETIVKRNKDKDEYISLVKQKRADFSARADKIIDKELRLLVRQLSRAIDRENEIDELIDVIADADAEVISDRDRTEVLKRLARLKIEDVKAIITAISDHYYKACYHTLIVHYQMEEENLSAGLKEETIQSNLIFLSFSPSVCLRYAFYRSSSQR